MFRHILVATDGSEISLSAGRQAIALARSCKARLCIVMACPSFEQLTTKGYLAPVLDVDRRAWEQDIAVRARATLERLAAEAERAGVPCGTVLVVDDNPHHAIIGAARENGCDLIVMGSYGRGGIKRFILGSQTARVLSHTKIPVLVFH